MTGNREGYLEEILQLSIQVIKTGTTILEELTSLGYYRPIHPKFGSLYIFRFNTPQSVSSRISVNLETKVI